jgi:radical SAM superfamily enzyme YgiQ (UPF0313 family)
MKLTLIKPNIGRLEHSLYVDEGRMEPLTLGVLAALTPADIEVALYDDRIEAIPFDAPTDLVAITVETYTARRAYEIAAEYRQRGVPVILGGMHVSLLPEEASRHADSIFIGDAEAGWAAVMTDAKAGGLQPRYVAAPGVAQQIKEGARQGSVLPRRDLFVGKGYLPISLLQFSRGCCFDCGFCAVSRYFDRRHFLRRIDEVVAEVESLNSHARRFLFFVDDNIAADRRALKEFCHALIPLKVHWVSQASLDMTADRELMRLLEKSGCWGNVIGFESITPESLRDAKKAPNLRGFSRYREEVAILREYGMQTWAAFTLGYDHDTAASITATVDFALENRFSFAAYNILMPYPGTPFYQQLARENRLLYDGCWWLHPQYRFNQAAFRPAQMSPNALTEACHTARSRFNSFPALLERFSDPRTNLRTLARAVNFLRYALLFRREVYKKHGMRLGLR